MPVHDGGHRSSGVLGVFPAKPLVPGASAGAGGGARPVELPDPARHVGDLRSQVSLGLWTSVRFAPRCAVGAPSSVPSDNHVRQMLDGNSPTAFDGLFVKALESVAAADGLSAFQRLGGRLLIALDGTEHFGSRKIGCPRCSTRRRTDGGTEYFHAFLGASVVAPGHAQVVAAAGGIHHAPGRRRQAGLRARRRQALAGPPRGRRRMRRPSTRTPSSSRPLSLG